MTFAVCVEFTLRDEAVADFMPLIAANAQTSLDEELGCLRFDVLSDPARPTEVFLYELYESPGAFQRHLKTPHFKAFDAAVTPMIAEKAIRTYEKVRS